MKANELMIGDWVSYCKESFQVDYFHRITDTIGLKYKGKSPNFHDGVICAEDANPIPITPEILEKNGFKFEHNGLCTWCDGINNPYQVYVSLWFRMDCSVRIVDVHNHREKFFTDNIPYGYYVHELQHALRLCGLKRLADDFMVKED